MAVGKRMQRAYLDNQTQSRPHPATLEKWLSVYKERWENFLPPIFPFKKAQSKILSLLGASSDDRFVLTASGSQAIQQLFLSVYIDFVRETGRTHFLTIPGEIPVIQKEMGRLEKLGCSPKILPVNSRGQVTREILKEHIRARTSLVSLSWANPITGVVQPIADLGEVCKEKEVFFHVDATATLGKLFFRFQDLNVDFLTFEGSSLHAPLGTGGVLVRGSTQLLQKEENSNTAALSALAHSLEKVVHNFDHLSTETARLRNKFEKELQEQLPDIRVLFSSSERVPHISAIAFPGVHREALLLSLENLSVFARSGGDALFDLLETCKEERSLAHTVISFSLSFETTEEELDYATDAIVKSVKKLKKYSKQLT